jgi:glycosyltransferase involved in cell wall biosynthesis
MNTLSVIIASSGRKSLERTFASLGGQLKQGDEVLVSINSDCPWGHAARNQLMPAARGDSLMFIDDDDVYLPGALDLARGAMDEGPNRVHIFRMEHPSCGLIWKEQKLAVGNVSTQMIVVPNRPLMLGTWGDRYQGDYDFIAGTIDRQPRPVWHEETLALYGRGRG